MTVRKLALCAVVIFKFGPAAAAADFEPCEHLLAETQAWVDERLKDAHYLADQFRQLEERSQLKARASSSDDLDVDVELVPPDRQLRGQFPGLGTRYVLIPWNARRRIVMTIKTERAFEGLIGLVALYALDPARESPLQKFMNTTGAGQVVVTIEGWPAPSKVTFNRYRVQSTEMTTRVRNFFRPEPWREWDLQIDGDSASHWHLRDQAHLRARLRESHLANLASARVIAKFRVQWIKEQYDLDLDRFETYLGGEAELFAELITRLLGHRYEPFRKRSRSSKGTAILTTRSIGSTPRGRSMRSESWRIMITYG